MSQSPSYVVRQEASGKLKLLLVRDPRAAAHVAKISPVKKQPPSQSPPTSQRASSSLPASQAPQRATESSGSDSAATSRTIQTVRPDSGDHVTAREGEEVRKVKGGRVVKLHSKTHSKRPPSGKSPNLHTPIPHSHTTSSNSGMSSDSAVCIPFHQPLLPMSRIRTIMKTNIESTHSTHTVSQDSVAVVAKATELFIAQLARDAHKIAMAAAERGVSYRHLATSVRKTDRTDFLHDILPEKVVVRDYLASLGNQTDHTHNNNTSANSSQ